MNPIKTAPIAFSFVPAGAGHVFPPINARFRSYAEISWHRKSLEQGRARHLIRESMINVDSLLGCRDALRLAAIEVICRRLAKASAGPGLRSSR